MAIEVLVPKLGMTMTEGTVAEWLIPDGGEVKAGEIIYRLETEKINFEVEAEGQGTVRHVVPEGSTLEPGSVVAYILAAGEAMPAGLAAAAATAVPPTTGAASPAPAAASAVRLDGGRIPASPIARRLAQEAGLDLASIQGSGPGGRITEEDVRTARTRPAPAALPAAPRPAASPARADAPASPLARRLAEQLGIDLASVPGTGPGGRITKEDVEQAAAQRTAAPASAASRAVGSATGASGAGAHRAGEMIPLRGMRKVIAERMHASLTEMAQLTLGMNVIMDDAVRLRAQLIDEWAGEGIRPSYADLVVMAVAKALSRHPLLNARITETGIELLADVHIGLAVALDDGLMVPVVRDAGRLPLKAIATESSRLAAAARGGKLGLDELAGGTFSVTALGSYDVDFFTPIVNPPNVAILGVGRIHDTTVWEGERPERRRQLTLSLTIDHRAVDGAPAAAFLQTVRDLLQAPYRLLV